MKPLVLGVVAAAVIAGCGGSDSDDNGDRQPTQRTTGTPQTGDDFTGRIDALCKAANPELAEIRRDLTQARDAARAGRVGVPETLDTFGALLRRASVVTERFEARLRTINPPVADTTFYDALVDSVEEGSANLRQQVRAVEAQDTRRLSDLSVKSTLIDRERRGLFAGHGGFEVCGRGT